MTAPLCFCEQNLQNHSFKGQDLTHADFRGSDLRGCDFTGAILVGANFERVQTGQSPKQINQLRAIALFGPLILGGFSFLIVKLSEPWWNALPSAHAGWFLGVLSILLTLFRGFFGRRLINRFPRFNDIMGLMVLSSLLAVMTSFTLGLAVISVFTLTDGMVLEGVFLVGLAIAFTYLTWRIFRWLIHSINTSLGTSFRKADLTGANFSHAFIQTTDFSMAILTDICTANWRFMINSPIGHDDHNKF